MTSQNISIEPDSPSKRLPPIIEVLRVVCYLFILALLGYFLSIGTVESRVHYVLIFAVGLLNPIWAIYGLALMGPLYLLDQSKTHLLAGLDVFILGMFAGELRLLRLPPRETLLMGESRGGPGTLIHWGLWPHFLVGLMLLLLASSMIGLQLLVFQEDLPKEYLVGMPFLNSLTQMFYYSGAEPEWTLKSLWNWGTAAFVAVLVARRATPTVAARWLKLGGLGLLVACFFSLLDYAKLVPLTHIRVPNYDPLHAGRLQGTAGHGGWYAEWIVMMWPGLLLWWAWGRNRRNAVVAAALGLVALTLVLTAARAGWLGVAVPAGIAGIYLFRVRPQLRPWLLAAMGAAIVLALVGFVAGGEALRHRILNILRTQDRANYYVSGLYFLREHPLGLGLGTHYQFYEWTITPFFRWYQSDHVTAHSLWLHTLIENGPFVPLLLAAGVFGVFLEVFKSWDRIAAPDRRIVLALLMAFGGVITISFAQYIAYIRIVELSTWIAAGLVVGITRHARCETDEPVYSRFGPQVLLVCGLGALIVASMNAARSYPGKMPRNLDRYEDGLKFWTGTEWSTPVDSEIDKLHFSLTRKGLPVDGEVILPNGQRESFHLEPDEWRYFSMERESVPGVWYRNHPRLIIRAWPQFTPSAYMEDNDDDRPLGVLVHGLEMESPRIREIRAEYERRTSIDNVEIDESSPDQ